MTTPTCKRCDTAMAEGIAMAPTYVGGAPDFPNDRYASTFTEGGTGRVVAVWKCPDCGHSFRKGELCVNINQIGGVA